MGWIRRVGWYPADPEDLELRGLSVRRHQADDGFRWTVRTRQAYGSGAKHPMVFASAAIERGHGVAAVFANKMHDLRAMEQAAFTVRGVVRASGE